MKLKKTLLTLSLAGTGLVALTIGLPLLLTSCWNNASNQNPITFNKIDQPVQANQEVKIAANVANLDSYNVSWSYCANNDKTWIGIKSGIENTNNTSTLTIKGSDVTVALNSVVFKITITNKTTNSSFSATTSIQVTNPEFTDPVNPNIKISISGNTNVILNQEATLKATVNSADSSITKFGYQWYYREKTNSSSFYLNSFTNKTSPIDGWTSFGPNANTPELKIPANKVTSALADYQLMVVVYDLENKQQYNVSAPIEISFKPISALGDVQVGSMMSNIVTDVTKLFTKPSDLSTQVTPNSNPLITSAIAKPELVSKIATALGLNSEVIQNVEISLGDNLTKDGGFWNGNNVSLNILVTLKPGYTFGDKQTSTGCNADGLDNTQAQIVFEGNLLTISNIQTSIKNFEYKGHESIGKPSPQLQALATKILSYNWNNFDTIQDINVQLNSRTLPLFQDFAEFMQIPLACISSIDISGNKTVTDPTDMNFNRLYFTLYLKGVDLTNFQYDGLNGSNSSFIEEVGNSILAFQLTDYPNQN